MPAHRFLYEFEATANYPNTGSSNAGWTELWYFAGDQNSADAIKLAKDVMNARRLMLTPGWSVRAIRVSELDPFNNLQRKSFLVQISPDDGQGAYSPPGNPIPDEQPYDALNISCGTVGGSRRAFLMRGIGDDVIAASGRYTAPAYFVGQWPTFISRFTGEVAFGAPWPKMALRVRGTTTLTQIKSVVTAPVTNVSLVIDPTRPALRVPAPGIAAGRTVSITGVADMIGINGQWTVQAQQGDPLDMGFFYVVLRARRRISVLGTYKQGGVAASWGWVLDNLVTMTPSAGASRRTGRPPQQLRGRRSSRQR